MTTGLRALTGRRLRLRPGTEVLLRGPGELQLGTDPRWSVRLTGLTDAETAWLHDPGSTARSTLRDSATKHAIPPDRVELVLQTLHDALLLVPAPRAGARTTNRREIVAPARGAADSPVLSTLRPDGAGDETLRARAASAVGIVGLGRLGVSVAVTLATAGVGTLVLDDPDAVQATDIGLGGYRARDIGMPRQEAARRIVADAAPGVRTEVPEPGRLDVVVVVEHRAADPEGFRRLMGEGIAHLSVVLREADVLVGPFVRPGRTPCVSCVDRHRADQDAGWPTVADQLRRRRPAVGLEETALAALGSAVAASQVLADLDGLTPRAATACIEIALPDAVPRLREAERHPECGCSDLTATRPVS